MIDDVIKEIARQGLMGIVALGSLYALKQKDAELTAERRARIEDANAFRALALQIQERTLSAVDKLTELAEGIRELMGQRKP